MAIIHLTSRFNPPDLDIARRQKVAAMSWHKQPWLEYPVDDLPRWWREEGRTLPFIRDLFDAGCLGRDGQHIVVFTNTDSIVRSDASLRIAEHMQHSNACYSYRMDFGHQLERPPTDLEFSQGRLYPGSDLVAFRCSWWIANRIKMPDLVLSFEAADPVLRQLVDETNSLTAPNEVVGLVAHERHYSWWEDASNRYRLRGQLHNLGLAKRFFLQRGINPVNFGIRGV